MKDFNLSDFLNGDSKVSSLLELNEERTSAQQFEMIETKVVEHDEGEAYIESFRHEVLREIVSYLQIPYRSQLTRKKEYAEAIYGYIVQKHKLTKKKKKRRNL